MKKLLKGLLLSKCLMLLSVIGFGQDVTALVQKVKAKIEKVNDYQASGKMKTNVAF